MDSRKHLSFFVSLGVLGLLLVGCVYYVYAAYTSYTKVDTALRRVNTSVRTLVEGVALPGVADPLALTDENVAAAKADLVALQARQGALRIAISGPADSQIDSRFVGIANELGTQIQESVARWRELARKRDIRLATRDETCFGFRRYVRNVGTQPQRLYREVDRQRKVIEWILETLIEARTPGSPLLLQSIDREPIETYPAVTTAVGESHAFSIDTPSAEILAVKLQPDEFVLSGYSFRRPGLVGSLAFRVRFVGKTDTLRAFINLVQNSGKPVVVSGIEISQPNAEALKELFSTATTLGTPPVGAAQPALPAFAFPTLGGEVPSSTTPPPKVERVPVVPSSATEFTVRLEYLFPLEAEPAK